MNRYRRLALRPRVRLWSLLLAMASLGGGQISSFGFTLLGPFDFWMTAELGQRQPSDVGGPANVGQGYRWNVPVVTYGFDQQFVNYFGTQGVAAVEEAFAILNDLPPASRIVLTNFAPYTKTSNALAASMQLMDLKSMALAVLLEQMGLAPPTRNVWLLRARRVESIAGQLFTNYVIVMRNLDAASSQVTNRVNDSLFAYDIREAGPPLIADAMEVPLDPSSVLFPAVADRDLHPGELYSGLSQDDVGGLRYLLQRSTLRVERLPAGVHAPRGLPFINRATRAGVEHIGFIKLRRRGDGSWRAFTNSFIDRIRRNGVTVRQGVKRVIRTPDILFQARNLASDFPAADTSRIVSDCGNPLVERNTVARWRNYSHLNSESTEVGPGIIPPGAVITFAAIPYDPEAPERPCVRWGSFEADPANEPVTYPVKAAGP